jgi:hypothetical protein
LPPKPGVHATFARDHEYKRHGTLSLLAGIDLLTGKVHALVRDRHRSREFIEFLKLLDAAYPPQTAIKLILDNHSAHRELHRCGDEGEWWTKLAIDPFRAAASLWTQTRPLGIGAHTTTGDNHPTSNLSAEPCLPKGRNYETNPISMVDRA